MIDVAFQNLIRGKGDELRAYLEEISFSVDIPGTQSKSYCHFVQLDGNGRPRVKEFIDFITSKLIEYSIPRSEIEKAQKYYNQHNSTLEWERLRKKAKVLFTDLDKTGEGGEILLYILVQEFLNLPQLFCKMPLKTNPQMHYHGVDGIHAEYLKDQNILALYWGESKLYQSIDAGLNSCFKSIKEYLLVENSANSPQERDLQLVKDNLDLENEDLENALLKYFDKDDPMYNKLQYRGVCMVGFDYDQYPKKPNTILTAEIKEKIKLETNEWTDKLKENISNHQDLDSFTMHVFLIPFPSVKEFRDYFLKSL